MNVTASRNVSAIFRRTMITERRRRQNDDTDSLSHSASDFFEGITPRLYSFSSNPSVSSTRSGSRESIWRSTLTSLVIIPQSLLYFL